MTAKRLHESKNIVETHIRGYFEQSTHLCRRQQEIVHYFTFGIFVQQTIQLLQILQILQK